MAYDKGSTATAAVRAALSLILTPRTQNPQNSRVLGGKVQEGWHCCLHQRFEDSPRGIYGPSHHMSGTLASSCPHSPSPTCIVQWTELWRQARALSAFSEGGAHRPRGKAGGHLRFPKVLAHSSALRLAHDEVPRRTEAGPSQELPAVLMGNTDDNGSEWWGRSFNTAVSNDSHCSLALL